MRRLPLLLAVACGGPSTWDPDDGPTDGPADVDSDTEVAPERCRGSWTFDWTLAPPEVTRSGVQWEDRDAWVRTLSYEGGYEVSVGEDACLVLDPGEVRIELRPTHCAARRVRATFTDTCGPTCTRLAIASGDAPAGENRSLRTGVEETLELAPGRAFTGISVSSLGVRLCAVEVELAPLPPELALPDTAAPF